MDKKINKIYKTSSFCIFIVVAIAVVSLIFIGNINEIEWTAKISAITSVLSATGGIISAILITSNFIHTKYVSIEAQRPSLLIQVVDNFIDTPNGVINAAQIIYKNITNYSFKNLKINVSIKYGEKELKLNKVFPNKMILLGQDSRNYTFIVEMELEKEGINIYQLMEKDILILQISYNYEFNNETVEDTNIQNYQYVDRRWVIL